jgi:hypothetical protein
MVRRWFALVLVSALAATGLLFAPNFSLQVGSPVELHEQTVRARDLTLICPGPAFYSGGANGTSLGKPKQDGTADLQATWQPGDSRQLVSAPLGASGQSVRDGYISKAVGGTSFFTVVDASGTAVQGSTLLSAVQLDAVSSSSMAGLLGASCQRPQSEFWLVGGDTTTGREALLVLSNAANIDATVELKLVGSNGQIAAPGLTGISVAAGESVVLPIASLSPKNQTFSIHVQSRGAALAGWIQQKTIRGTQAQGADLISPTGVVSNQQVIPGFFVRGSKDVAKLQEISTDFDDLDNLIRITNPGSRSAVAIIQITGANSKTFGTVIQADVPARSTVDLPVTGLQDGDYAIFVQATEPVLAAAKLNRTSLSAKQKTDFAWLPSVEAAAGERTILIPKAGISKLSVANPTSERIELALTGGGLDQRLELSPGATRTFTANASSIVRLSASGLVATSLVVDVDYTIAVLTMQEQRNLGGRVGVLVR